MPRCLYDTRRDQGARQSNDTAWYSGSGGILSAEKVTDRVQEITSEVSGVEGGRDHDLSLEKSVSRPYQGERRMYSHP